MSNGIFKTKEVANKAYIVLGLSALLVVMQLFNQLTGLSLIQYGLMPRETIGLFGIITSPFIHGSISHLSSNLIGFIFLSSLIIWRGIDHYFKISIFLLLSSGILVWILGPVHGVVVGASGVIFGYIGYLLAQGAIERETKSILIALAVGFMYGGALFGIFPGAPGISWQSHLAGFICGIVAAYMWRNKDAKKIKVGK